MFGTVGAADSNRTFAWEIQPPKSIDLSKVESNQSRLPVQSHSSASSLFRHKNTKKVSSKMLHQDFQSGSSSNSFFA